MATLAAKMMLRYVLDGTLSLNDLEIERRPYHHNCGCALHKMKGTHLSACNMHGNVSFPRQKSRGDHCLSMTASEVSSRCSHLLSSLSIDGG
ncbi:uncharacterized protein J3R85_011740 [Psidium guajava]|nr:uncharacterized protein J3R85_011740 [Psidium guajava]